MVPPFRPNGTLPPGIHWADWEEFVDRFASNPHRQALLAGLEEALYNLQQAGCQEAYIDGSFVTAKPEPADFDGCWSKDGVDPDKLDPVLMDLGNDRAAQKAAEPDRAGWLVLHPRHKPVADRPGRNWLDDRRDCGLSLAGQNQRRMAV